LIGQCIGNALIGAANNVADQFNGIFAGTKTDGFDVGSVLVDGAIGAVAGLAGDAGAGNKGLTSIALTNLRRSWNTFTHQGIKPALSVFGKGMAYFGKSARHMLQPLSMAIKNSSVSIIINNAIKDIIP
jgi:hypothetical protein